MLCQPRQELSRRCDGEERLRARFLLDVMFTTPHPQPTHRHGHTHTHMSSCLNIRRAPLTWLEFQLCHLARDTHVVSQLGLSFFICNTAILIGLWG